MSSQTTDNYLQTNIQQHIVNKYWSSELGVTGKVVFYFGQDQWSSHINQRKIGSANYYFTDIPCNDLSSIFDNSKIGNSSSGNYIRTIPYCYLIEISSDFQKIRIKTSNENKWRTFYLLSNPNLQN